jgi:hypothetical protein
MTRLGHATILFWTITSMFMIMVPFTVAHQNEPNRRPATRVSPCLHWEGAMGIFSNLFGGKQRSVMAQLPQVESAVGNCVADFKDRTKLSYALIFPIMQAVAVRLYVQDFGVEGTRQHFERLVKLLTDDGTIREDQYKSFESPEIPPQDLPHTTVLNAILWQLSNALVARGYEIETVASALVNISLKAATKSGGPIYAVGLLMTSLKELRSGVYG